ncbi:AMP-binding protein [Halalkalicoccus jeotgali]|uniref:AMP-dependent synthetase and ligase n=1 Tax=Halalkalicoccus jeotgali (strain DSM 18796 / CECT 7217 / JCM 14584 / KCTC 4019 / B3) TaxID=795797 RepID=D8J4Q3_HALJB|nr:AMP-binding protein [Halalkalicoccus jeotgali]ADJ15520.1 AMP-dependent synthetase and ligase [Halalkalicoccus jeotgali B3]ELY36071.1 AMP-dependent synthetase and ligase [Halalkalicoccus jeotgali B3]
MTRTDTDPWYCTLASDSYEQARREFEWSLPEDYNLAYDLLRKHADPDRPALYQASPDGRRETYTFGDLDRLSNRVANALEARGIGRGDRVGVVVPQKPENALTHLACWKIGAISLPLSPLFGPDALSHRLTDSGARVVVADASVREALEEVEDDSALEHTVFVDGSGDDSFESMIENRSAEYAITDTDAETPAIIMYTSGSTGPPKGVLHSHGVWVGHCPAFSMYFELDVDGTYWTPADWAWIGALGDLLFPAWHYGQPVVGSPLGKFSPEEAFSLMEEFDVTGAFLPPTAIRMMMEVDSNRYDLSIEAICSGGEPLTPEILEWADEELGGVPVNELYGQTEANLLVTNCREWFPARAGSMGKPVPGHDVRVIDPGTGEERPTGEVGEISVRRGGDPVVFHEYWNRPKRTDEACVGPWHRTGDLGYADEEGYLWFKSRDDDLIITSGYRVGPREVEEVLLDHEAVAQVGVIGVPDETRGEIVKAVVQPVGDGSDQLREELRDLVRDRLAKYEYPREIEFREELPQTTTGKIRRKDLLEE